MQQIKTDIELICESMANDNFLKVVQTLSYYGVTVYKEDGTVRETEDILRNISLLALANK